MIAYALSALMFLLLSIGLGFGLITLFSALSDAHRAGMRRLRNDAMKRHPSGRAR